MKMAAAVKYEHNFSEDRQKNQLNSANVLQQRNSSVKW